MKISVCMATYNGEKFIKEQINSILNQLDENDEIIISDNGSNDNTVDVVKNFTDARIKLFIYKRNDTRSHWNKLYNITANFENAINKSCGDIIMFCDQDDIWEANKISTLKNDLTKKDCVFSNYCIIDEENNVICARKHTTNPLNNPIRVLLFPPFLGCTMAVKRSFLRYYLPFPQKLILHDIYIGLIAYLTNKIYFEKKVLTFYRRHNRNVTTASHGKTKNNLFRIIAWRSKFYFLILVAFLHFTKKSTKHNVIGT